MENLLAKAGCGERDIALYRAEAFVKKGQPEEAARLYASIGETGRTAQLASEILRQGLASYDRGSLDASYARARAIYDTGNMDPAPLVDEALALSLTRNTSELSFSLYMEKGLRAEAEALVFTKDSYSDRAQCLPMAAKLGLTEAQFYERLVKLYEEASDWRTVAKIHLERGDDVKLRQAVKRAFEPEHLDSGIVDVVLKRGDLALSKSAAEWIASSSCGIR